MACTHHILDDLVFAVLPLDFEQVVAKVEEVEAALLSEQHDDGAARPVQPIPEALPGRKGAHKAQDEFLQTNATPSAYKLCSQRLASEPDSCL